MGTKNGFGILLPSRSVYRVANCCEIIFLFPNVPLSFLSWQAISVLTIQGCCLLYLDCYLYIDLIKL